MKKFIYYLPFLLFVACTNDTEEKQEQEHTHTEDLFLSTEQVLKNGYTTGSPSFEPFEKNISFTGKVDLPPSHQYVLHNYIPGYVKKINVIAGDRVKKGQTLAIIEHQSVVKLQEDYLKTESALDYLAQEFERLEQLYTENIVAKKEFLAAKNAFDAETAKRNSLLKQLELIHIYPEQLKDGNLSTSYAVVAPSDGVIAAVSTTVGSWAGTDTPLIRLFDPSHIHLELAVFAKDLPLLEEGQPIHYSIHGEQQQSYTATVHKIGAEVNADRRVQVHAHPDSMTNHLTIDAYVNGVIHIAEDTLLALPPTAFSKLNEDYYLLEQVERTKDGYRFEKTKVAIIQQNATWLAIDPKWENHTFLLSGVFDLIKNESEGGHTH